MKFICLGDSLTEGYEIEKSWVELLDVNHDFINKGIGGDTSFGLLSRFYSDVILHNPDYVIIMCGSNDIFFKTDLKLVISNIYSMTKIAEKNNINYFIGIPTKSYMNEKFILCGEEVEIDQTIDEYRKKLILFCQETEIPYLDFNNNLDKNLYLSDGLHPNQEGHQIIANTVKDYIRDHIK